ncbi:uncharacterized protein PHACADRAFT_210325 [Phanerochaete carnosa HHB-10118-sp]|uniref:Inosine/uridine-preferring nucleoside hydrolase domain-containing protein n=1 Tax=Phanerochaete carnosa (strain HHB-10118-sp) TaxID=650164 RepID=K5W6F2_PHACS|nr:uncharacterized protein PHACADRAFT_210325 [Phanerochaete carnosa HHB-10118-sp]EKM54529.1 hypothetical protein PHACADRAFT_210325 [Phanerochaete carnosa HHB-10118-sp]
MTVSSRRIPVIIDTDPGVDDVLAILLALASPELDIRAIIVTFGNTDVEAAYLNILRLHKALALQFEQDPKSRARFSNFTPGSQIILAKGANGPLEGELLSAEYFHGRDGLGDIDKGHPDLNVDTKDPGAYPMLQFADKPGEDVALDIISTEPVKSISYIILGPMTSFARLMRKHGDTVRDRLGQVICMGGALDVPGNSSAVAEFNFFADPFAVKEIFEPVSPVQGFPLERFLLVPLDTTTPHEITFPYYKEHIDPTFENTTRPSDPSQKAPLLHFTSAFLERTREVMIMFGKDAMELHDIVAVWCAIENPPPSDEELAQAGPLPVLKGRWGAVRRKFQVERLGEITRGMLVVDRREGEGAYDPGVNRAAVQAELEMHGFHSSGALESTAVPAQVELETAPELEKKPLTVGVPVVNVTPGPAALLRTLTERVWGVVA